MDVKICLDIANGSFTIIAQANDGNDDKNSGNNKCNNSKED